VFTLDVALAPLPFGLSVCIYACVCVCVCVCVCTKGSGLLSAIEHFARSSLRRTPKPEAAQEGAEEEKEESGFRSALLSSLKRLQAAPASTTTTTTSATTSAAAAARATAPPSHLDALKLRLQTLRQVHTGQFEPAARVALGADAKLDGADLKRTFAVPKRVSGRKEEHCIFEWKTYVFVCFLA
jgi:hypothetical protein